MALFSSKTDNDLQQEAAKASKEVISSILSKDMTITGEISFKGKTRIDGTVDGNIKGEHLVLSESGKIYGDLEVDSLVCHGRIEGNIKAKLVTAHSSAAIQGKLTAANLSVEAGALLEGEISASAKTKKSGSAIPAALASAQNDKEKGKDKK